MYLEYWGLTRPPFQNLPDTGFFFETPKHREAIIRLLYAVKWGKGLAMLTGEVGCGKTLVCYKLLEELRKDRYESVFINNPCLSAPDFLKHIYEGMGGHPGPEGKRDLLHAMVERAKSENLQGRKVVVIIDEAHLVAQRPSLCEEIRMLLNYQDRNRFLFNLIMVGQPDLLRSIAQIPQLRQRIAIRFHIDPLTLLETHSYINHRLKIAGGQRELFSAAAVDEIFRQSNGIPRLINTICDLSLLISFGTRREIVEREDVQKIRELLA